MEIGNITKNKVADTKYGNKIQMKKTA